MLLALQHFAHAQLKAEYSMGVSQHQVPGVFREGIVGVLGTDSIPSLGRASETCKIIPVGNISCKLLVARMMRRGARCLSTLHEHYHRDQLGPSDKVVLQLNVAQLPSL